MTQSKSRRLLYQQARLIRIQWAVILALVCTIVLMAIFLPKAKAIEETATPTLELEPASYVTPEIMPEPTIETEPEEIEPVLEELGEFRLTAYCACRKCCGKNPGDFGYGVTASGAVVEAGRTIAVDSSVMPVDAEITETGLLTYQCEHVLATLIDNVLFGYHVVGNRGTYTADCIRYVLNRQRVQNWVLYECDFARQFEYGWTQETLLSALFSIATPLADYMWVTDTSVYPWRLSLKSIGLGQKPQLYVRSGWNMLSYGSGSDPQQICTRLYPLGYDNTAAAPTLNVSSTGAKSIYYKGEAVAAGLLKAGYVYLFQYNGTQYELLNPVVQSGGGFYPVIVVTAPTGSTVTATDGETSLVGTEVSGKWTFQIPSYGVWNITATLNGQTATTSVSVTEVKQYTVTLTYFAATIAVTYPSGSTCTCSNGTTTLTAPNTTGSYTFTVPSAGTWTVKSTNGTDTAQQAISITTNGQSASVTLSYKPTASTSAKSGVNYTTGISSLTAEKMSLYAEAISRNSAITNTTSTVYIDDGASHYKISVGDSINIAINGTSYAFKIMGFNHDTLTSSTAYGSATATGKAGMTLQMADCLAGKAQMNSSNTNSGGWENCAMRKSNMATYLSQLTSAWQNVIKQVNKLSSAGSQSTTIKTTADKLFLLSEVEIFGSTSYSVSGEGTQYAYYKAGNSKVKNVSGSANSWWERSPLASDSTTFCNVDSDGSASNGGASYSCGVAFGFCV